MAEETAINQSKSRFSPVYRQMIAVSGVVLYMIGTGANIAYPGVLLQQLREPGSELVLTVEHESWIASILGLALISGICAAPWCLQHLGRKLTNQVSTLPAMAGWAMLLVARGPAMLLASRSLQGFAMGIQAASAPVSIAEYSAPKLRGAFLATIAFSFATGMLIAHIFGIFLYWRNAAMACGSVYVLSLILISLSPETPPYLASKGLYSKCRKSFHWLRGNDEESEKELEILLNSQKNKEEIPLNIPRWKFYKETVKKPEFYKPTLIMMFMFVLFQVSGMTVVPSYTIPLMKEVTGDAIEGNLSMLIVDLVRFLTAILACVVVNKFNRRTVLFVGIYITVISLFLTSLLLYLIDLEYISKDYKWVPLIPTLTYIFGKTLGILPIPWAIAGEVFPLAYRSLGSGISGMFLSIMFFVVVKTAPNMFESIGVNGTFFAYGVFISICGVFLYFLLPETKGKTLYEIECYFRGDTDDKRKTDKSESHRMLELEKVEGG